MTLAHAAPLHTCAPSAVLACDEHRDDIEKWTREFVVNTLNSVSVCCRCWGRIRLFGDLIRSVVAL